MLIFHLYMQLDGCVMVIKHVKKVVFLSIALSLAGCFDSEVECDSSVTKERIIKDFKARIQKEMPEGAMDYITNIELAEIVTLAADKNAQSRSCEAKVVVHTSVSEHTAFQDIKYENQTVSGGAESTRSQYSYADTFNYIATNVYGLIKDTYEREIAKKKGFDSYAEYQAYTYASARLIRNEAELVRLEKTISELNAQLKELYPVVAETEKAIASGRSVLLTNEYMSMQPVFINTGMVETKFFDKKIVFSAEVKNTSKMTVDGMFFSADIFLNGQGRAFKTDKFTSIESVKGLKPGETRKVKFSVSGEEGITNNFLETTSWQDAKSVQIRLTPKRYMDASGRESLIGRYRDHFALNGKVKGEPITWDKYAEVASALSLNEARLVTVKNQIESDKAVVGSKSIEKPAG
ncbi:MULTISPECIES: hypothetical protein [Stutzerimonas]|uniref:hypothetical protein n=1 Tax=Stutzerimonas TaxID=2901164 RepID=UPI000718397E|nr:MULTISPECIES: hypothetical protein [Stutzerimonas]KRW73826.1 hypothetical protein AO729_00615 [Pseudomonas sp. TTU2014-066ASC]QUE75963.1 hypothetical protein KCX70_22615 [Stutzerimonas stutzeri]